MAFSFHNSTIILRDIFSNKVHVFLSQDKKKSFMSQNKLAAVCGFQITIIFATLQLRAIRTPVQQETKIVFPSIFFMQLFSHITIEQSSYCGADVFILTLQMYIVQHCLLFLVYRLSIKYRLSIFHSQNKLVIQSCHKILFFLF